MEVQGMMTRAADREVREGEWFLTRKCRTLEIPEIGRATIHPLPMLYQQVQYVPVVNGMGVPCVMPCWALVILSAAAEGTRQQVVYLGGDRGVVRAASLPMSSVGSISSGISVHYTGFLQGRSSTNARSNCSNNAMIEKFQQDEADKPVSTTPQSSFLSNSSTLQPLRKKLRTTPSVNKPTFKSDASSSSSLLPYMPCVAATGKGPNGRIITGFLYR